MKQSLRLRLIVSALCMMAVFLAIAGWAIQRLYAEHALSGLQNLLESYRVILLSAAGEDQQGHLQMPDFVLLQKFNQSGSGLYAGIRGENFDWHSRSAGDISAFDAFRQQPADKHTHFHQQNDFYILNSTISWDDKLGNSRQYLITIVSSLKDHHQQMNGFLRQLIIWLGGSLFVLLAVQLVLMVWGLRPLKKLIEEVTSVEHGTKNQLEQHYPTELSSLKEHLNSLIKHSQNAQQRYRKSLGDLAHSLKTPLALLQTARDRDDQQLSLELDQQLPYIDKMIHYHLQRAAMMGQTGLAQHIEVSTVAAKIANSLDKIYHQRRLSIELDIPGGSIFHGDETDLTEMLANLMDNACKHARQRILVSARRTDGLELIVDDDGKGMADEDVSRLLQRGKRADEQIPGHGLGLSIVMELVQLYQADLTINKSDLGGSRVSIHFHAQ